MFAQPSFKVLAFAFVALFLACDLAVSALRCNRFTGSIAVAPCIAKALCALGPGIIINGDNVTGRIIG